MLRHLALPCLWLASLPAQVAWTSLDPGTANAPSYEPVAAWDLPRGRLLVLADSCRETRAWNGSAWVVEPPPPVTPRYGFGLCTDLGRGRIVLFGGADALTYLPLGDTLEWNGSAWLPVTPANVPPPRSGHGLGYDLPRGRVVLFGGIDTGGLLDETWEYDGVTWTLATPAVRPSPRIRPLLCGDDRRGRIVLHGGIAAQAVFQTDTWEWDGTTWVLAATTGPSSRREAALCFDRARGRSVLHGGIDGALVTLGETWEWDGAVWAQRAPSPDSLGGRHGHALVYDPAARQVLAVGGRVTIPRGSVISSFVYQDLHRYAPLAPASVRAYGAGCGGGALPVPAMVVGGEPWLGDTLQLGHTGPGSAPVLLALGLPLPNAQDLGGFGLPGCWLHVQGPVLLFGLGALPLSVPNAPGLLGAAFGAQMLVADPGYGNGGLGLTGGQELRVGGR